MNQQALLSAEWSQLLLQSDQYERCALFIKLLAIGLVGWSFVVSAPGLGILALVGVCWISEGIWKTFQGRTDARLLVVENAIRLALSVDSANVITTPPMQFYTEWERSRPSSLVLAKSYLVNALRPTVAITYSALVLIVAFSKWWHL